MYWWEKYPRLVDGAVLVFWAALVGASLLVTLRVYDRQAEAMALDRARMIFAIVETTRLWSAQHGGAYVPATAETPPNPYLPEDGRDVEIDGKPYTLVNPAYMTRQIAELLSEQERGLNFRITSRRPIRPQNAADSWEHAGLDRLAQGETEILERRDEVGAYRYLQALYVSEPCLACHAQQGYSLGEQRGGISVTVPIAVINEAFLPQWRQAMIVHGLGYLILVLGSFLFLRHTRRAWRSLGQERSHQERLVAERTAELQKAVEALKRSNQELETFAYVASHDLQAPLRMVTGYGSLIERRYRDKLDDEGRELLDFMTGGARQMQGMINDLLQYSRVERADVHALPLNLRVVAETACSYLQSNISEVGATVELDLPNHGCGDEKLLIRLFQNLLSNALKYRHPERPPHIHITATHIPPHGEAAPAQWEVRIRDNGLGIPAEQRERAFQIFQRLHPKSTAEGTGIGLSICRKIVERHGGTITLEDTEGGGLTVRFTLPCFNGDSPEGERGGE